MEVVHTQCAGLDVHKKTVVAAIMVPDGQGGVYKETRTFGTMTADLLALSDWLSGHGVTHAALESTGEYWKPVFNILESNFEVLLVNAQHVKAVPGRKTDINDAEWLADLLRHGLLRASFIPPVESVAEFPITSRRPGSRPGLRRVTSPRLAPRRRGRAGAD
jgi:transposase